RNMKIVLIEAGPDLLGSMSKEAKESAFKYLQKLGVDVMLKTMVKDYDGEVVTLADNEPIQTQTLLWAAGITPNRIEGLEDSHYAPNGRIFVDHFSEVKDLPGVYALGDISIMMDEEHPKGHPQVAQVAMQQAKNLAKNFQRLESKE